MATTLNINSNSRRVLLPPVQSRRVRHETLDKSVPIDHDQDERLALEAHLAFGIGANDDRLTLINLSTGKMAQLPSRASIFVLYLKRRTIVGSAILVRKVTQS